MVGGRAGVGGGEGRGGGNQKWKRTHRANLTRVVAPQTLGVRT